MAAGVSVLPWVCLAVLVLLPCMDTVAINIAKREKNQVEVDANGTAITTQPKLFRTIEEFNTTFPPINLNETYLYGEIEDILNNLVNLTDSSTLNHALDPFYAQFGTLGIHYDVLHRRPYIICQKLNRSECDPELSKDCPVAQRCFLDTSKRTQRLGCMSVYNYNATKYSDYLNWTEPQSVPQMEIGLMGCWQHDAEVLQTCSAEDKCMQDAKDEDGPSFCCCTRHMCNHFVKITHEHLPISSHPDTVIIEKPPPTLKPAVSQEGYFETAMFGATVVVLMLVLCTLLTVLTVTLWNMFCKDGKTKARTTAMVTASDEDSLLARKAFCPNVADLKHITDRERISFGRFGVVYRGLLHGELPNGEVLEVAVKVFSDDQSWCAEQDIYTLPSMRNHPHILHYIASEVRNGEYCLITQYQAHGSLYDYLKSHLFSLEQSMRVMTTLLDGMAYLHEERTVDGELKPTVAHRDVKSRNILIRDDLSACIADFGLSMRSVNGTMKRSNGDGHGQVGTNRYMSPELLEGATEFSPAAFCQIDVYATALVLWEIMSRTEVTPGESVGEHKLPYEVNLPCGNPSLAQMKEIVVTKKIRPSNRQELKDNAMMSKVCDTLEEMWDKEGDGRITSACALERLRALYRDSGTVSEEENIDSVSTSGLRAIHPRMVETSLSSAGFNHEMANYENERIERGRMGMLAFSPQTCSP